MSQLRKEEVEVMFCYQCSKIIKDDSKFCQYCGAVQEVEKKWKPSKGVIICIALIIVFVVFLSNIHTCDWCDRTYFGGGYYDSFDAKDIMCEDCAQDYYRGIDYTRFKVQ